MSKKKNQPKGEVLAIMSAVWSLDHALRSASKHMRSRMGVTGPQRLVIRMVGRHPGIDAGTLAGILRLHPSTLTGILVRLEKGKYLLRSVDPADGRRHLFRLTVKGKAMNQAQSGTVEAGMRRALTRFNSEQIRTTRDVLEALAQELAS